MLKPVAEFIDASRIWQKTTFQRGRILKTRGREWERFGHPDNYADPSLIYGAGSRVPDMRLSLERTTDLAEITRYSFPTLHPIESYPYAETNRAAGRIYRNRRHQHAPVAILSHGWAQREVRAVEVIYAEPLLKAGYSVAVPTHPFHFERKPAGTYSGELMVSGDVLLTVEAFRQSVIDLLGLYNWLRETGDLKVGVLGYSMGGYVAGLAACVRDDLEFAVVAGCDDSVISPILDTGIGVNVREDLSWSGMHERENLERAWGIISPGRLALRTPKDRVLLVSGIWDQLMTRSAVTRLWENWGRPEMRWQEQGHYTLLAVPGRVVRRSLPFLSKLTGVEWPSGVQRNGALS